MPIRKLSNIENGSDQFDLILKVNPEADIPNWAWYGKLWYGLFVSNEIVGYGSISVDSEKCFCWEHCSCPANPAVELSLNAINIKECERGKGYGRTLVKGLIGISKRKKVENLALYVERSNNVARHLYESLGFTVVGSHWSGADRMEITYA